jgi:hypothetical protein
MNTPSALDTTTKPAESDTTPAQTKPADVRKPVPTERMLRHDFTDKETLALGRELSEKLSERSQLEADLNRVKGDFKARDAALEAKILSLRDKVNTRYELRTTKCEWRFDDPKPGFKTIYRLDSETPIETEPMTEAEKQIPLPLDGKAGEGAAAPANGQSTPTEPPPVRPKPEERPKAARVGSGGVVGLPSDGDDIRDPDASKAVHN